MPAIQDNIDVAILSKVNELAERFGLRPYDVLASIRCGEDDEPHCLQFESVPEASSHPDRMVQMLNAIGVDSNYTLTGTDKAIYDALESALQLAPRRRTFGDGGRFSTN